MLTDRAANMAELSSAHTHSLQGENLSEKTVWETQISADCIKSRRDQYKDKRGNVRTNVTSRRVHVTISAV
jgi:hypothetical protein